MPLWFSNVTNPDQDFCPDRPCSFVARLFVWCISGLCSAAVLAQPATLTTQPSLTTTISANKVLPADTAFKLQAFVESDQSVVLLWDIMPGYYLYRQSISVSSGNDSSETNSGTLTTELPAGSHLTDEFFGDVEVYYDKLLVKIAISSLHADEDRQLHFQLGYQGCAKDLYCYPPQQKDIQLSLP